MGKRRGRPSKSGRRTASGRLVRAETPESAKPSEWVKARFDRFGSHYCWALGRAYASGLLGEGNEAKDRLDSAGKFVTLYQRYYGGSVYSCPLDQTPRSNYVSDYDHDRQTAEKDWLKAAMLALEASGGMPFFEQLITRAHVDTGPSWLDRLLAVWTHNKDLPKANEKLKAKGLKLLKAQEYEDADLAVLKAAIVALDAVPGSARTTRRAA